MKRLLTVLVFTIASISMYAQPTWSEDIACIVYSHCSSCHNDVGVGPFNLMNYQNAFDNRYSMLSNIVDKKMPPWPPNQDYQELAHANVLSQEEIDLFSAWVDAGAPEGDPMLAPETPVFETNEEITDPDVVLTTETFTVPSINDDLYKCFVIETNWPEDKFVSALEIFPNNRNIVHHVLVYTNETNDPVQADQNDPAVGFECGGSIEGGDNILFGEWVPGSRARILPDGTGIRIPSGANLVLQVHYPEGTSGQSDFITLNMKFEEDDNVREVLQDQTLDHLYHMTNGPLFLLPFETKTFHQEFTLPEARTFLAAAPHAHLICTKMWSYAEKPNGEIVNLIEIPDWDFDWQGFYDYPEPIILPAGTTIHGYARYQNDNDNPNNPSNPPTWVSLGEETTDEMMIFFYSYLMYEPGDENIITGGEGHIDHHDDCTSVVLDVEDPFEATEIEMYPNPINTDQLFINWEEGYTSDYEFELIDISGKLISSYSCNGDCEINIPSSLNNGFYLGRIKVEGKEVITQKVVVMR